MIAKNSASMPNRNGCSSVTTRISSAPGRSSPSRQDEAQGNERRARRHCRRTFAQNVLKEKNAASIVVRRREDLAGLSENEIAAAAAAAKEEKKEGKFVIRLQNTSGQPALASLQNRPLREQIMKTSLARNSHGGEWDNREVVIAHREVCGRNARRSRLRQPRGLSTRRSDRERRPDGEQASCAISRPRRWRMQQGRRRHAGDHRPGKRRLPTGGLRLGFLFGKS